MPTVWTGRWKGGRRYNDRDGRPVYVIERRFAGRAVTVRLATHDEQLAVGELAAFEADRGGYLARRAAARRPPPELQPVYITDTLITEYLEYIRDTVRVYQKTQRAYLVDWSQHRLDLRIVSEDTLKRALASFTGGHRGRTVTLNAFARWCVHKTTLAVWRPLVCHIPTPHTRAPQVAYSIEQLVAQYHTLPNAPQKALFLLRAETGLHHTEVQQLQNCGVQSTSLADRGVAIRTLGTAHEIRGVIQVVHKSGRRHRQSVGARALEAALLLREHVPSRRWVHRVWDLTPSNLRHTFATLGQECGRFVVYTGSGVSRAQIAQAIGHRKDSTMVQDHYDRLQVPPMIALDIPWEGNVFDGSNHSVVAPSP